MSIHLVIETTKEATDAVSTQGPTDAVSPKISTGAKTTEGPAVVATTKGLNLLKLVHVFLPNFPQNHSIYYLYQQCKRNHTI